MKRYTQFSIAAMLCVTAVIAGLLASSTKPVSPLERYYGVWKVIQGVDNAAYGSSNFGFDPVILVDTQDAELVLTSTRLFHVSSFKTFGFEILDAKLGAETKLKLRELRTWRITYIILKRTGSKLTFAFVDAKTNQIDASANGKQIVYTAKLQDNDE